MPPLTDNSTSVAPSSFLLHNGSSSLLGNGSLLASNVSVSVSSRGNLNLSMGTNESTWSPAQHDKRHNHQVVLEVPVHFAARPESDEEPAAPPSSSPFEDFDETPLTETVLGKRPGQYQYPSRPTPRVQSPQGAMPTPTPTPAPTPTAGVEPPPTYPFDDSFHVEKRSPSYHVGPPLPRATPPPTPVQPQQAAVDDAKQQPHARWDTPAPTPTSSPNATTPQHHHNCTHPDNCPCPGATCVTQTDVVWIHNVTTLAAPTPAQAQPTSICETVQQTSVYWETEQEAWLTTVFPVMSTYWVWEKIPHTVQSLSTSFSQTFYPGPSNCPLPPSDWCEDGWIDGVWHGDGEAPCWWGHGHHHHWHWPGAHDIFGTLGSDQIATLVAIPIMLAIILVLWSIHILAVLFLLPFQLFTNFVHEVSHVIVGIIGGAKICSVTIDPGCGPLSTMRNGSPAFTLLAGYTGSLLFGWGIVTCAFDEKASKITYIITSPVWLPAAWFTVGLWPKLQIAIVIGWSIALWYIWEGRLLRFYMLFLGLMSVMYVLWDCLDDFIFHKQNESDASLLSRLYPSTNAGTWAFVFLVISLGVLACACVAGLHWFQGPRHIYSENFLPT